MTLDDLKLVREYLDSKKIDVLNTRVFKKEQNGAPVYVVTLGSIQAGQPEASEFKGQQFELRKGEFSPYLVECNTYLKQALKYSANENQQKMIEKYIEHFESGSINAHKDSQRHWVKDKGPVVETNIGWIETYVDPENVRAYWEGWVAIVDKEKSKKF